MGRQVMRVLTDEVPEPGPELDLGLDKGVAVAVKRDEEDLLHLVRELSEPAEGRGGYRGQHLGAQELQNFL